MASSPPQCIDGIEVHPKHRVRGAFIVLEGLDRSGKTTQVKLLEQRFVEEGQPVKAMRFPDRSTPVGQMIDSYLKSSLDLEDHVVHLLFTANRWEAAAQIRSLLASGTSVISDRFYHSGIVYSAAKQNPSLSLAWARAPERGLPQPDLILFLDLDEREAKARGGWGDELYEESGMQRRVRELFRRLSHSDPTGAQETALSEHDQDLVVVDAGGSVEAVADDIWERVKSRMRQVDSGDYGAEVRTVA